MEKRSLTKYIPAVAGISCISPAAPLFDSARGFQFDSWAMMACTSARGRRSGPRRRWRNTLTQDFLPARRRGRNGQRQREKRQYKEASHASAFSARIASRSLSSCGDISDAYRPAMRTIDSNACFISNRFRSPSVFAIKGSMMSLCSGRSARFQGAALPGPHRSSQRSTAAFPSCRRAGFSRGRR